jgi:hypothetical protein
MLARPIRLAEQRSTPRPVEIIRLPIEAARRKAREIINQTPQRGFVHIVENWRFAGDGEIEFTIRRLRAAD